MIHKRFTHFFIAIIGFVVLLSLWERPSGVGFSMQPEPIPSGFTKKQLDEAETLIRDVFKDEFAQIKTNKNAGKPLAQKLLEQSQRITEEKEVRYMALVLARDLSAEAGDHVTAFTAINELAKHHQVNVAMMRADVMARVIEQTTSPIEGKNLAEMVLKLANQFGDQDDFDMAVRYGKLAEAAAKKANQPALAATVSARLEELITAQKETGKLLPFLAKLKNNPDDGEANLEVGKSWCFVRDKWEKGLPYLVKGNDSALKEIAKKDLQSPLNAEAQAKVAEGWRDLAAKYDAQTKLQMLRRSYQWYMRAVFQMEGDAKAKLQGKIKELVQILPAKLRVTEIETELKQFKGHGAEVLCVAFSPGGLQAVSGSADKTIKLWDLMNAKELQTFQGHFGPIFQVAFSADGKHIFSCSEDKTVRMWDVATGKETKKFEGQTDFINGVAVSPDGKLLAGVGQDKLIHLWDIDSGKKVQQMAGHTAPVFRVAFSPDGSQVASTSEDQSARLWDVKSGKQVKEFRGHTGLVIGLAFSPDGKMLATGSEDNSIRLWEVASGKELLRLNGHTAIVGALAFSPEGSRLVSASDDRSIRFWDTETGQQIRQLLGHTDAVYGVAVSPDGRWVLSGSLDRTVRLWGERK